MLKVLGVAMPLGDKIFGVKTRAFKSSCDSIVDISFEVDAMVLRGTNYLFGVRMFPMFTNV